MSKLERAKATAEDIKYLIDKGFGSEGAQEVLEDMRYLLSLLEEKDKALAKIANTKMFIGSTAFDMQDIARKALNTSSNTKGEI